MANDKIGPKRLVVGAHYGLREWLAQRVTASLDIPTIGIGAGPHCDAQVLVWQDMAGMTAGKTAKFVKRFGDVGGELRRAATQYAADVATGAFPGEEHCF